VILPALPPNHRDRLVKLLGLLGSHHMAERATAGRMAHELLRSLKLTWDDVLINEPEPIRVDDDWEPLAEEVARSPIATRWEREFAANLLDRWAERRNISPRQRDVLERAYAKRARRRA